jgi:hypothetical protein
MNKNMKTIGSQWSERLDGYKTLESYSKFKIFSKKLTKQTGDFVALLD